MGSVPRRPSRCEPQPHCTRISRLKIGVFFYPAWPSLYYIQCISPCIITVRGECMKQHILYFIGNLSDFESSFFFFFLIIIYLFIFGCVGSSFLCEGFLQLRQAGATLHRGARAGLSPSRPLSLRSTGSRRAGSAIVAHGPGRSAACGILPDQGSNTCSLHRQADSQPLRHQGSPSRAVLTKRKAYAQASV